MSSSTQIGRWHGLVVDCPEPDRLAIFYQDLLGMVRVQDEPDWVVIGDAPDRPGLAFQRSPDHRPPAWPDPASAQQMHLDVRVEELLSRVGASYRVFADPADHPFCLVHG